MVNFASQVNFALQLNLKCEVKIDSKLMVNGQFCSASEFQDGWIVWTRAWTLAPTVNYKLMVGN